MVNKAFGVVALLIFASIGISIYMNSYLSSNYTAYPSILQSMMGTFWPELLGVGILVTIIFALFVKGKT